MSVTEAIGTAVEKLADFGEALSRHLPGKQIRLGEPRKLPDAPINGPAANGNHKSENPPTDSGAEAVQPRR